MYEGSVGAIDGWIKLHRKMLDNPVVWKDSDHLAVWIYLLLNATHKDMDVLFKNKRITLKPGQLITGRKSIAKKLDISESKVHRVLKMLEIEQQIEQQTSNKNRLIAIVGWNEYQSCEQQIEQQVNNNRTTSEQQVNTNKNIKNDKNDKKEIKPPYPLTEFGFSSRMEESIHLWLKYKKEKKDSYTETGFKTLLGKMKKNIDEYGEQAVISLMDESMSNNWKGIIWSKLESNKKQTGGNPFKEALRKELENEQNGSNCDHDGYQGGLSKLLQEPGRGQ